VIRPMKILVAAAWCAAGCLLAQPARAQIYVGRAVPHNGSIEVSGGVLWTMGFDLGTSNAELTRNPGTGAGPYDLFTAATRVGSIAGVQGHVGVYLSRSMMVEGGVQYSRPVFSSDLANDAEQASDTVATETLARYVFDGSFVYHFGASGGKAVPFVAAGGGYIRELHDGYGVVETGNEIHGAVGIKYWFTNGKHRLGLRADLGLISRSGGVDFEAALHALPTTDSAGIDAGRRTLATTSVGLSYLF
jgi:hypothetical protein